jgi:hypothetical protein
MHCWVWCCICELHHVFWCLCVEDGYSQCCGSCVLWKVMFGQSQFWEVWHSAVTGSCIKTAAHKLKAELFPSPTDVVQSCTCWSWHRVFLFMLAWHCGPLYMLAVIPCALIHAGRDAVCCCTCWPWCCMLWHMLSTVLLYTIEHAGHGAVCSCTCWQWRFALLYMLAMLLCFLACACHNTVYSCMWLPQYCLLLYMLVMMLCAPVHTVHDTVHPCTC